MAPRKTPFPLGESNTSIHPLEVVPQGRQPEKNACLRVVKQRFSNVPVTASSAACDLVPGYPCTAATTGTSTESDQGGIELGTRVPTR
eukprot:2709703-Rhodomonas_salina.1